VNDELNEPTSVEASSDEATTAELAPTPKKRRVRWFHIVVLGIAVLACAAGVGFFVNQSSEHDDATAQREHAQAQLASQRRATDVARTDLAKDRADTKAALTDVAAVTTSLHEFSDLLAQHVDAVAQARSIAAGLPGSVDDFNAAVDRANALLTQIQQKSDAIDQQVKSIRDKFDAQLAASTSQQ
jgi:hypothetical protein